MCHQAREAGPFLCPTELLLLYVSHQKSAILLPPVAIRTAALPVRGLHGRHGAPVQLHRARRPQQRPQHPGARQGARAFFKEHCRGADEELRLRLHRRRPAVRARVGRNKGDGPAPRPGALQRACLEATPQATPSSPCAATLCDSPLASNPPHDEPPQSGEV